MFSKGHLKFAVLVFMNAAVCSNRAQSSGIITVGPAYSSRVGSTYPRLTLNVREKLFEEFFYQSWSMLGYDNQLDGVQSGGYSFSTSQGVGYSLSSRVFVLVGASYGASKKENGKGVEEIVTRAELGVRAW